jgi:hypothetical protein
MGMLCNDQQKLHDIVIKHAYQKSLTQPGPVIST